MSAARIYVGVDQALRKMGVCVLYDGEAVLKELLRPDSALRGAARLAHLRDLLLITLNPWKGRITAAAMEAQSLGSLGDIDQLGQINGVVQVVLTDVMGKGPPLYSVAPAVLKKFVTGHSGASKGDMMRVSARRWGYDFVSDDICDAHGLARIAEECVEKKSTIRHEIEATTTVLRKRIRRKPIKRLFARTI